MNSSATNRFQFEINQIPHDGATVHLLYIIIMRTVKLLMENKISKTQKLPIPSVDTKFTEQNSLMDDIFKPTLRSYSVYFHSAYELYFSCFIRVSKCRVDF